MTLVGLVVLLIILGVVFFFVEQIPMAAPFPTVIRVVAAIVALLIILQFFGINTGLHTGQIG